MGKLTNTVTVAVDREQFNDIAAVVDYILMGDSEGADFVEHLLENVELSDHDRDVLENDQRQHGHEDVLATMKKLARTDAAEGHIWPAADKLQDWIASTRQRLAGKDALQTAVDEEREKDSQYDEKQAYWTELYDQGLSAEEIGAKMKERFGGGDSEPADET